MNSNLANAIVDTSSSNVALSMKASSIDKIINDQYELWHKKLVHALLSKLRYVPSLQFVSHWVCVTDPMAKFSFHILLV